MKLKRIVPPMLCKELPMAGTRSDSRPSSPKTPIQARMASRMTTSAAFWTLMLSFGVNAAL